MTVFATSDDHFFHRRASEHRGFSCVEEHNTVLADNWSRTVHPKDDVWVLGDCSAGNPTRALELIAALPGRKHLIAGNHDACHSMHRDAHNWQRRYLEVFDSVQQFARRKVGGVDTLLSHFPYHADRGKVRHTQYRLRDEGTQLLHGHLHLPGRITSPTEVHVGVDAWGLAPVPLEKLVECFAEARNEETA